MSYLPFEKELYIPELDFSHSLILQQLFHHNGLQRSALFSR